MALSILQTKEVLERVKAGMRVASFGYPDIIAPLPDAILEKVSYRSDSEVICKRHGLKSRQIPDAESFFDALGAKLTVYDVIRERGCEILLDLNEPMEACQQYDIVLDVGTLEHCFNIAQAIMNMAMMVKMGGTIIHENPFNWANHGFYNLNPTFYNDFYCANGFTMKECALVNRAGMGVNAPLGKRFTFTEVEVNVFVVAERVKVQEFVYPVQAKYQHLIPAAGVSGVSLKEAANG